MMDWIWIGGRSMARLLAVSIVACVLTIAELPLAWSQAETGSVNGSVTGANGPAVGVTVVIASASVSSYTARATTDQNGAFAFSDTPVGWVELKVYDQQGNFLVKGQGNLKVAGDLITLALRVP
jgi:hypothetical protein